MEKYIVTVGGMWVSKVTGTIEPNGQITAIKSIELTSDISKAFRFDNRYGAKSTANRLRTYGTVIEEK